MDRLGATTASSSAEISTGLQKFAAVANTVGLSFDYAAAALATITATTRESADVVGTSLRTLFSRIQGLQQGQDQDDGTTLNKYSKALEKVGINIKDTQGNMKDMNTLLDEMGAKWNTLARDEQLALAQTVGGVRQYVQLVALMENYDTFRANIQTALTSEGELERQAQTYAKSWEAARNRVKAAAEDIYDSLINDQFYIEADNILTNFLGGIADVIDGLGGMKGIAMVAGSIMLQLYGEQLAQSMRDLAINIGLVTGKQTELAKETQKHAEQLASDLYTTFNPEAGSGNAAKIDILQQQVQLEGTLAEYASSMDSSQLQYIENEKKKLALIEEVTLALGEQADEAIRTSKVSAKQLSKEKTFGKNSGWQKEIQDRIDQIPETVRVKIIINDDDADATLANLLNGLRQLVATSVEMENASTQLAQIDITADGAADRVKELAQAFGIVSESGNIEELQADIQMVKNQADQAIRSLQEGMSLSGLDDRPLQEHINNLYEQERATQEVEHSLEAVDEAYGKINDSIENGTVPSTKDWADKIIAVAQKANDALMVFQAIRNLGNIWGDDTLSTGEKLLETFSNIVLILPTIASLLSAVKTAKLADTVVTNVETAAISANTTAIAANTVALLSNPLVWIIGLLTAAVGTWAVYTNSVEAHTKALEENTKKQKENTEQLATASQENNDLIKQYQSTLDIYKETGENKDELDELTDQLADKFNLEGEALAKLSGKYEEYNDLLDQANQKTREQLELQLNANNKLANAAEAQALDVAKNLSFGPDFGWVFGNDINGIAKQAFENNNLNTTTGSDYYFDVVSAEDDMDRIVSIYNAALEIQDKLAAEGLFDSDLYKNATNFIDTFSESVETYKQAIEDANRIKLKLNVDDSGVETLNGYRKYIEEIKEQGGTEEDIQALVQGSTNSNIQYFADLENAISQIKEQSGLAAEEIDKIYTSPKYDESVLNSLSWNLIDNREQFEKAYESAEKYKNVLSSMSEAQTAIGKIQQLSDMFSDGIFDAEELEKLPSLFESTDEMSNFLELSAEERAQYIKDAYLQASTAYSEGLAEMRSKAIEDMDASSAMLESLSQRAAELRAEFDQINGIVQDSSFANRSQAEQQAILDQRDRISNEIELTVNKMNVAHEAIQEAQSQLDDADLSLKINIEQSANDAIERTSGNIAKLSEELREGTISAEVYDRAFKQLADTLDSDLDPEKVEDLTDYIIENAESIDELDDALANDKKAARDVATEWSRFGVAMEKCEKNYDDWLDTLENGNVSDQIQLVEDLNDAYNDLLNFPSDLPLSDGFLKSAENLQLFKEACEGSEEAFNRLQEAAREDILVNAGVDLESFNEDLNNLLAMKVDGENTIGDLEVGAYIENEAFIEALNEMINAAGLTADECNAVLGTMGLDADVKTISAVETIPHVVYDMQATIIPTPITYPVFDGKKVSQATGFYPQIVQMPIPKVINDQVAAGGFSLEVSNVKKSSGGKLNYANQKRGGGGSGRGGGGGGKGGGGGTPKETKIQKVQTETQEPERYHSINRIIQKQEDILNKIDTAISRTYGTERLRDFEEQQIQINKQIDNLGIKLKSANSWLKVDQAALSNFFSKEYKLKVEFGEDGDILNYDALEKAMIDRANAAEKAYADWVNNIWNKLSGDEQEEREKELEAQDERLEKEREIVELGKQYIAQLEETTDLRKELNEQLEEYYRQLSDIDLNKITHRLEILVDYKELQKNFNDLAKDIRENIGTALDFTIPVEKINQANAKLEVDKITAYRQEFEELQYKLHNDPYADKTAINEELKQLSQNIADATQAVWDWAKTWKDLVPNALDAAMERFKRFTDQLAHNNAIVDTVKQLMTLQGASYRTAQGFQDLQKATKTQYDSYIYQSQLNKQYYENAKELVEKYNVNEAELKARYSLGNMTEQQYQFELDMINAGRDAAIQQMNETEQAMLDNAQKAIEAAQQMMLDSIDHYSYQMEQKLTKGFGFDLLQDKFDHYLEKEEFYFDKVNEAYQTASWFNKLQDDIDKSTNKNHIERLKALQEEVNIRRQNNTLSQYDLDILEAKYKVLQAQMALEDAQNNKNQMRLVRDRQGNWNYQYNADPNAIDDAQKNLADAEIDWYNIAKARRKDMMNEIIQNQRDMTEQLAALDREYVENSWERDEQYYARKAEIENYYLERDKRLREEYQIAVDDMTEAGNTNLFHLAVDQGDRISDLTGITADQIYDITQNLGLSVKDLLEKDLNSIAQLVGDQGADVINSYTDVYLSDIEDILNSSQDLESAVLEYNKNMTDSWNTYGSNINKVATECAVSMDQLRNKIQEVADANEEIAVKGAAATAEIWEQVNAVYALAESYRNAAEELFNWLNAQQQLNNSVIDEVGASSGVEFDPTLDYRHLIHQVIKASPEDLGLTAEEQQELIEELMRQREAKIQHGIEHGLKYGTEDYYIVNGVDFEEEVRNLMRNGYYEDKTGKVTDMTGYTLNQSDVNEAIRRWKLYQANQASQIGNYNEYSGLQLEKEKTYLVGGYMDPITKGSEYSDSFNQSTYNSIDQSLGNALKAGTYQITKSLDQLGNVQTEMRPIEQTVTIQANFPNATDRNEIGSALMIDLPNQASQYVQSNSRR